MLNLEEIGITNPRFRSLATQYEAQTRLTIEGGKLIDRDGWGEVARHCLIQAAAIQTFAPRLGLDQHDTAKMAAVAACHDWAKRLEKKPQDFSEAEKTKAKELFRSARPNEKLMEALEPHFLVRVVKREATFVELVQFYVDDIARGGEIVSLEERLADLELRRPNVAPEVALELGRPYWEAEREIAHRVERMLASILYARHETSSESIDVSSVIRREIERLYGPMRP